MPEDLILSEANRSKLDNIVSQMAANKESDANIQFVVNDFKNKYGSKSTQSAPQQVQAPPAQQQSPTAEQAFNQTANAVRNMFAGGTQVANPSQAIQQPIAQPQATAPQGGFDVYGQMKQQQFQDEQKAQREHQEKTQQQYQQQFDLTKLDFEKNIGVNHSAIDQHKDLIDRLKNKQGTPEDIKQYNEMVLPEIQKQQIANDNGYKIYGLTNLKSSDKDTQLSSNVDALTKAIREGKDYSQILGKIHEIDPNYQVDLAQIHNPQVEDKKKQLYQDAVTQYQIAKQKYDAAKAEAEKGLPNLGVNAFTTKFPLMGFIPSIHDFNEAEKELAQAQTLAQAAYKNYVLKEDLGAEYKEPNFLNKNIGQPLLSAVKYFSPIGMDKGTKDQPLALKQAEEQYGIPHSEALNKIEETSADRIRNQIGGVLGMVAQAAPLGGLSEGAEAELGLSGENGAIQTLIKSKDYGDKLKAVGLNSLIGGTKFVAATSDPSQFKAGAVIEGAGLLGEAALGELPLANSFVKNILPDLSKNLYANKAINTLAGGTITSTADEAYKYAEAAYQSLAHNENWDKALTEAGIDPKHPIRSFAEKTAVFTAMGLTKFLSPLAPKEKEIKVNELVDAGMKPEEATSMVESIPTKAEQPHEEKPTPTEVPTETKINEPINEVKPIEVKANDTVDNALAETQQHDEQLKNNTYEPTDAQSEVVNSAIEETGNPPQDEAEQRKQLDIINTALTKGTENSGNQAATNAEGGSAAPESVGGKTEGGQGNAAETEIGNGGVVDVGNQNNNVNLQNETDKGQNKGTGTLEKNTEQVRYNGTDAIGQRSRPESEKAASRKKAKEKISSPENNVSLKAANDYNKSAGLSKIQSHEFKPSDKEVQSKIGETYEQLQDVTSPTYKETELERQIFDSYKSKYPELFEKYGIKSYKDLVEKSYAELVKEVNAQFEALPIKVEFHEGDHNYESSAEMLDDVHNFGHLWVFKGGDDHTLLGSKTADKNGITANDKFRGVHDYFGHSIEGYEFGKNGEENAWIEHSKMFSPLAQIALSSETRGQNSFVNYSGVNDVALEKMKTAAALTKKGLSENNSEMIAAGKALLNEANNEFQFAEQKSIVLPEKYTNAKQSLKETPKAEINPIRQLGTGANVYFETNKYRVNDTKDGVVLNIHNETNEPFPIANEKFDTPSEAVYVAKKLNEYFPNGIPREREESLGIAVEGLKKEYQSQLNQNTNEKANEVREIEKGQRKPEDERGQPIGGKERQKANVQEEKVGQGEATPQSSFEPTSRKAQSELDNFNPNQLKIQDNATNQKQVEKSVPSERKSGVESQQADKTSSSNSVLGTEKGEEEVTPTGVSKAYLKEQHNKEVTYETKTVQQRADEATNQLNDRAAAKGISADEEAAQHVAYIISRGRGTNNAVSDYDVIITGRHFHNLENEYKRQLKEGNSIAAEEIRQEMDKVMEHAIRASSNATGGTFNLFGAVFAKMKDGMIEATRNFFAKELGIESLPKSMEELNAKVADGTYTKTQGKHFEEYIKQIDQLRKTIDESKANAEKINETFDKKAVEKYIKDEVTKRLGEQRKSRVTAKSSQRFRSFAEKIRNSSTLDDLGFGDKYSDVQKAGFSFNAKEALAKVFDLLADGVEKAEAIAKVLKELGIKADEGFTDLVNKTIDIANLPDKREVLNKIGELAKAENTTTITKAMVHSGLVHDIINDAIHTDAKYDEVVNKATEDLKAILPDVTKQDVIDALLRKGEFQETTKQAVSNEVQQKKADVKRLSTSEKRLKTLESADEINAINADKGLTAAEKKAKVDALKSDYEKEVDAKIKSITDNKKAVEKAKKEAAAEAKRVADNLKKLETELERVQLRKAKAKTEKKEAEQKQYTEEEQKLMLEIEHEKMKWGIEKEAARQAKSDYKKIEQAVAKEAAFQDKLNALNDELRYVKEEKQVFDKATKSPKETNAKIKEIREQIKAAMLEAGVRPETANSKDVRTAKEYEKAIHDVQNDTELTDEEKQQKVSQLVEARDKALENTHQQVTIGLKNNVDAIREDVTEKAKEAIVNGAENKEQLKELQTELQNLSTFLNPSVSNIKDKLNQADQALRELVNKYKGTEFEQQFKDIREQLHDSFDKTSTELQRQQLVDYAKRRLNEAQRRQNAKQYTEIPQSKYDIDRDEALMAENLKVKKEWQKTNAMKRKLQDSNKTTLDKIQNTQNKLLTMSFGAFEKSTLSAMTKPLVDTVLKQSFGRLSGLITGVKATELRNLGKSFKSLVLSSEQLKEVTKKAYDNYAKSITDFENAKKEFGANSKQAQLAENKMKEAEIDKEALFPYAFIHANALTDMKDILVHGATDFDEQMGNGFKSYASERKRLENIGHWIDIANRTHGAVKSISARQAGMDGYIQNLQYLQKMDGEITPETREIAFALAFNSDNAEFKQGKFAENTKLGKVISEWKSSENQVKRAAAKWAFPVAKVPINIAKQGIDMALPIEMIYKVAKATSDGVELNKMEGKEYSNFFQKINEGRKKGIESLNLEQKKYLNTLLYRGMFGVASMLTTYWLMSNGQIKYGGQYNANDPFHKKMGVVYGSDGQPLKAGEWEFFGHRTPKIVELLLNHSPYSLPISMAAMLYSQSHRKDAAGQKNVIVNLLNGETNEVLQRLPFQRVVDLLQSMSGDEYKLEHLVASVPPSLNHIAKWTDEGANGEPIKRNTDAPTFGGRVWNIYKSQNPILNKTLPDKQQTPFIDLGSN